MSETPKKSLLVQKSVCNTNCCVYGCKSVRKKNPNLMFHLFPKRGEKIDVINEFDEKISVERRKLWETKLKMGKKASNAMSVCSLHFDDADYTCSGWSSRKRLLSSAIPSKNLPQRSFEHSQNSSVTKNHKEQVQNIRKIVPTYSSIGLEQNENYDANSNTFNEPQNIRTNELDAAKTLVMLQDRVCGCYCHLLPKKTMTNSETQTEIKKLEGQEVQVNTNESLKVTDFVQEDSQLNSLTGISSFEMFNNLVLLISGAITDKRIHRLSVFARVFLFFMKLKLDLPYVVLAVFFGISSQSCKRIFFDMAKITSTVLREAIPFPSKEEIQLSLPKCFRDFRNVRIVLDCTEIPLQRHKRLCCRIKTYSHYKSTHTIKFLTGVSPGGIITYVSKAYGGRCSDKAMFEQSGILDKLTMFEDAIMVDKGFLIEDLCDQYGVKLIRPPFLRKKTQLTHTEALRNGKIAAARVHIERTNQRIKIFRIFQNRLPVNLIPIIEDLFNSVCAIVNLSSSILADDKFL